MNNIIASDLKVEITFSAILEENANERQESAGCAIFGTRNLLFSAEYSVSCFHRGTLHLIDARYWRPCIVLHER
jgi:hypothetical protein